MGTDSCKAFHSNFAAASSAVRAWDRCGQERAWYAQAGTGHRTWFFVLLLVQSPTLRPTGVEWVKKMCVRAIIESMHPWLECSAHPHNPTCDKSCDKDPETKHTSICFCGETHHCPVWDPASRWPRPRHLCSRRCRWHARPSKLFARSSLHSGEICAHTDPLSLGWQSYAQKHLCVAWMLSVVVNILYIAMSFVWMDFCCRYY